MKQRFCKRCHKKTDTVYNDYFVAFCAECHSAHENCNSLGDYVCIMCGGYFQEEYSGQTMCESCKRGIIQ